MSKKVFWKSSQNYWHNCNNTYIFIYFNLNKSKWAIPNFIYIHILHWHCQVICSSLHDSQLKAEAIVPIGMSPSKVGYSTILFAFFTLKLIICIGYAVRGSLGLRAIEPASNTICEQLDVISPTIARNIGYRYYLNKGFNGIIFISQ